MCALRAISAWHEPKQAGARIDVIKLSQVAMGLMQTK